jgi:exodeoxyribonuclease V gamma subunit
LVDALAEVMLDEPLDPMVPEWLAVPSDGMRRWVLLELARRLGATGPGGGDGVAANIRRAYPGTLRNLVLEAAAATTGVTGRESDPWQIDRMVWPLLALFDDLHARGALPSFTALPDGAARFTRVRAVADLFDRYHLHRPEMIRAWADPDRPDGGLVDGSGEPLSVHARWQAELWRLLRAEIGAPSPPERMPEALEAIRSGELQLDLPPRLLLFGFTSLPGRDFLPLVEAVSGDRPVHLFLLGPHGFDAAGLRAAWPRLPGGRPRLRSDDLGGRSVRHPLLRSWGRLARETALLLADDVTTGPVWSVDVPAPGPSRATLLHRLQADIRRDAEATPAPLEPLDRSVQFHACFGPMRQVQVARDAILHLLDGEEGIDEEDVLVVCPDLERFAPLVEAVFGTPGGGADVGAPALRFRIADRSIRSSNPVLGAAAALLDLVAGRFEITQVLDFLSLAPVRARFGFDESDLGVLADWATRTRVRWGLDPEHRSGFGVPARVTGNTWQAALDRLLLGSAVTEGELDLAIGGVAPFGVDSGDSELLGSLGFVLGRLADLAGHGVDGDRTAAGWIAVLRRVCDDLFAAPDQGGWQLEALDRVLADVLEDAASSRGGSDVSLDLVDIRRLLEDRLDREPGRPDFFRGGVTVTSTASLRWVPFRIVCMLGLDQDAAGSTAPDAADLVAAAPQIGDPDPRSESRQALLEAVLSAGDHLLVVRDGRDLRSNHVVPQVVPVAELFDAVVALVDEADRPKLRVELEVAHPRHPFDEKCLERGGLVRDQVWSYSPSDLEAAERRRGRPPERRPFLDRPLDGGDDEVVELEELRSFLRDPVGTFVQRTLGARLPRRVEEVDDVLPVELDGLETYRVGQELLDARVRGREDEAWRQVERARGTLPPGVLEDGLFDTLSQEVDRMIVEGRSRGVRAVPAGVREIDITLPGGTRIVGVVPLGLDGPTPGPGRVVFSRPKRVQHLEAWLELMALTAAEPGTAWRSVVVTRTKRGTKTMEPVDLTSSSPVATRERDALAALSVVVDLYRRGRRQPIPLFAEYSGAVHEGTGRGAAWQSFGGRGDGARPAVRLVFGDVTESEIFGLEPWEGDPGGEGGRVQRYARRLWETVRTTTVARP